MFKFYDREKEIKLLKEIEQRSKRWAQMTFVVGRRRVGKTALLNRAYKESEPLYFFVEKKNEALLCEEFIGEISRKFDVEIIGQISTFKQVFQYLMDLSQKEHFTVIIDEFQDFYKINSAIYSEMQNVWDSKKDASKMIVDIE